LSPAVPDPRPSTPADRAAVLRGVSLLCLAILVAELLLPASVAVGGLYILAVLVSLWLHSRRVTIAVALACSLLSLAGFFLHAPGELAPQALANRALVLFAVWVTAHLGSLRIGVEEALVESREMTATTLRSIADAVLTADESGRVTFLNASAEALLGWRAEEARGRALTEVFVRAGEVAGAPAQDELQGELTLRTRDGRLCVVEASSAALHGARGAVQASAGRVLTFRDVSARKAAQTEIETLAFRDALTGLANRSSFFDRLGLELAHARRRGDGLALYFLDLDGFKAVNDALGHAAGDRLLVLVAERLRESLRADDTIARLGGDEFTVVLPGVCKSAHARAVAEKLVARLAQPYPVEGVDVVAPPSLGIALVPQDARDIDELVRAADRAMYAAKAQGGARCVGAWEIPADAQPHGRARSIRGVGEERAAQGVTP
jgi:diguanylate cyclase (GGDEF)-like protein/PAS domain S-box-containing protein